MYTLLIEGRVKPGKKSEFITTWNREILPTLKKQPGFVDEILLFGTAEPEAGAGSACSRPGRMPSVTIATCSRAWLAPFST